MPLIQPKGQPHQAVITITASSTMRPIFHLIFKLIFSSQLRHRVIPARIKGMTAGDTPDAQTNAFNIPYLLIAS